MDRCSCKESSFIRFQFVKHVDIMDISFVADGSNFGKGNPETTQVTIPNDVSFFLIELLQILLLITSYSSVFVELMWRYPVIYYST